MRFSVLAVGKIKEAGLRDAVDDYFARIRRYAALDEIELKDGPKVAQEMNARIDANAHVVALEASGKQYESEPFARWIERHGTRGKGAIQFLIGGAAGLAPAVVLRAQERLSLSAMTFPHRIARLLLAEQVYRAMTILRGEPYPR